MYYSFREYCRDNYPYANINLDSSWDGEANEFKITRFEVNIIYTHNVFL